MNQKMMDKAAERIACNIGEGSYCTLALIDRFGYPTASTITASQAEGIGRIDFATGLSSRKAERAGNCPRACVCFNSPEYNITLVGRIEVVTDPEVKRQNWYEGLAEHFSGPEDPDYCVLRFSTERYSLFIDWMEVQGTL